MKSRMYPFITETYNPVGGVCPYNCVYCWAKALIKRYGHKKYSGKYYFVEGALKKKFKAGSFVFLCDMLDLFAFNVPREIILKVLEIARNNPDSKFLLETKNPRRYSNFVKEFPDNVVLGVTVESNRDIPVSYAPKIYTRIEWLLALANLTKLPLFISIEPILEFDLKPFLFAIKHIQPWAVAIGYDNYKHSLPEPELNKTLKFIEELEKFTVVYRKTIKEAWWKK